MASRRIEQTFDCSVDTFWTHVFFNQDFNKKLYLERLRFERWDVTSEVEDADGIRRIVEIVPRVGELPGPLRSLLKDGAGYREEGQYFRSQSLFRLKAVPRSMADRVHISGEMRVEAIEPTRCRRTYVGQVEAKIFGVGGLIENRILDDIDKAYDRAAEVTNAWLTDTGRRGS